MVKITNIVAILLLAILAAVAAWAGSAAYKEPRAGETRRGVSFCPVATVQ
jgi:hypothetical protein